jgi:hypothetical protein
MISMTFLFGNVRHECVSCFSGNCFLRSICHVTVMHRCRIVIQRLCAAIPRDLTRYVVARQTIRSNGALHLALDIMPPVVIDLSRMVLDLLSNQLHPFRSETNQSQCFVSISPCKTTEIQATSLARKKLSVKLRERGSNSIQSKFKQERSNAIQYVGSALSPRLSGSLFRNWVLRDPFVGGR